MVQIPAVSWRLGGGKVTLPRKYSVNHVLRICVTYVVRIF
jgi:hypothetical protein